MKQKWKGLLGGFLMMSMLLSGCGDPAVSVGAESVDSPQIPQETTVTVPQTTASPQEQTGFGYETTLLELSIGEAQTENLFVLGDTVYLDAVGDDGHGLYTLEDGAKLELPDLGGQVAAIAPDGDSLWCCVTGESGLRVVRVLLEATVQVSEEVALENTENTVPLGMAVGGDGCFYLMLSDSVQVFQAGGQLLSSLPLGDGAYGVNILRTGSGQILLNSWTLEEDGSRQGSVALLNTESVGASLTDQRVAYNVYSGWDSTVLLSGGGNLYTLDTETGEMQALLSWIDSDVDPNSILGAAAAGPERIEVVTGDESGVQRALLIQTPVSELEEQTTLNVGLGSVGAELQAEITALTVAFNRSGGDFRVHLVDYSVYTDGAERLAADVGDLDLLIGPEELLGEAALMELTAFFDDTVGENTLTAGVLPALAQRGDVRSLPLYFTVKTLVGSQTVLGAKEGWTAGEFLETVQSHPEAAVLQFCNAYDTLDALLAASGNVVTDYASMLSAVSLIPVEDQSLYELEANRSQSVYACLQSGTLLTEAVELTDFMGLKTLETAVGADLVFKGYPADSGNGAMLNMPVRLGIAKDSSHPSEAWTFLKTLLSGSAECLARQSLGFPVLKTDFEAMAQDAMQGVQYQGEGGETVEENPVVWIDGEAHEVQPFTQEEIDVFTAYCAGNSGVAGGSESLRERARTALKQVIEAGADAERAAASIQTE